MVRIEKPILEHRRMNLAFGGWRGSNKVIEVSGLYKSFDGELILDRINLILRHGDRVGLIGPNGSGKSILLRIIQGLADPDAGEVVLGPSIKIGYCAQEQETLNSDQIVIDAVRYAGEMSEGNAMAFLSKYLFSYKQATQKIRNLSGGERSRLQLALVALSRANCLLLDELTNNLDIGSAKVLENALDEFEGAVLAVSRDRYFLDRIVNRLCILSEGHLYEYLGGYSDYLSWSNRKA
jgi:ATP-binding cassette subfamily F protein 3